MSSQASNHAVTPARRSLETRQGDTLDRLLAAARAELDDVGHEQLTIRTVATRAGVSSATAYNYFASRDHLFAELFWQHLATTELPPLTGRSSTRRLQQTTRHLAETIAGAPALAAAATKSLLGTDPAVEQLRVRIGTLFADRFGAAAGERLAPRVLDTLLLAFSGALLQTGMGLFTYPELADRLDGVVAVIMKGHQ